MKFHRLSAFFLTLVFSPLSHLHSQDVIVNPRIQITEVYVMGGIMALKNNQQTLLNFKKLAPNSQIFADELSDFDYSSHYFNPVLGVFNAGLALKFNKANGDENKNPILRLGLSYQGGRFLQGALNFETSVPYDTLVSSQTGEVEYRDSIYSRNIMMEYNTSQLLADIAVVWRSNPEFRWGLHGGLGFAAGLTFDNTTTLQDSESAGNYNNLGYSFPNYGHTEIFQNENSYAMLAYLPFGANFTLGRKNFWKLINLVVEFRPGISFISIPEAITDVSAVFPVSFGLKTAW